MSAAMVSLATITLGSAQATVSFSSIPATYRDLRLVCWSSSNIVSQSIGVRLNGDSGSNYSAVWALGYGTTPTSASGSQSGVAQALIGGFTGASTSEASPLTFDLMDYSATDKHKSGVARYGNTGESAMAATRWANTAAVTSLQILMTSGGFNAGSTFALYGIAS
jgi:hypothetical protein